MQAAAALHETPFNALVVEPDGSASAWRTQVVPLYVSAMAVGGPPPLAENDPTAVHAVVALQEIDVRYACTVPAGEAIA